MDKPKIYTLEGISCIEDFIFSTKHDAEDALKLVNQYLDIALGEEETVEKEIDAAYQGGYEDDYKAGYDEGYQEGLTINDEKERLR